MSTNSRLSIMMFLQYAIWGAWLPLFWPFLKNHRGLEDGQIGTLFSIGAVGALFAPFIAGQIADRWFNTEKFLAISHVIGAALVWQLATAESYNSLLVFSILYSLVYAPTLPLTNSLAFHHLADRDRDFGKVRVWGTVGWIAVGIGIGQWLKHRHGADVYAGMGDSLRLSAILGGVLGVFCLMLPKPPPQPGKQKFAPIAVLADVAKNWKRSPMFWLLVIAFPVSCIHQFYFVRTAGFLGTLEVGTGWIDNIFGVGGGGLMTIGQIAEIGVLAAMPIVAKRLSRKSLLTIGLCAYIARFAIFAYVPHAWAVIPALALHGLCFGCFFFVAFLIVDEETAPDVRASAQGMFNLVVVGFGVIVGNFFAGVVGEGATTEVGGKTTTDYSVMFGIPMWVAIGALFVLWIFYPRRRAEA